MKLNVYGAWLRVCNRSMWKVEAGAQGYLWAQIEFKRGWSGLPETLPPKKKKTKKRKGEKNEKKLSGNAEL